MIHKIRNALKTWDLTYINSKELRHEILNFLLTISYATCFLVTLINIYNQRPLSNILLPAGLGILIVVLYRLSRSEALHYAVKLTFMLLISLIYIPFAWLTSPGSSSAMPMYTLMILVVTVLLIERTAEFIIPILLIGEILSILHYEGLYPERFTPYTDSMYHAFDLSINFTAIAIILTILLSIVNRSFSQEHRALYQLSITDQLTGTYNRHYLYRRLGEIHSYSRRHQQPYALIMIDINNFKQVNDRHGHHEGDQVLKLLGSSMITHCRSYDVVVRYGGDEFLIILPDCSSELSEAIAQRIRTAFLEIASAYPDIPLDLAIGIAENIDEDLDSLLLKVDNRLYQKKNTMKQDTSS